MNNGLSFAARQNTAIKVIINSEEMDNPLDKINSYANKIGKHASPGLLEKIVQFGTDLDVFNGVTKNTSQVLNSSELAWVILLELIASKFTTNINSSRGALRQIKIETQKISQNHRKLIIDLLTSSSLEKSNPLPGLSDRGVDDYEIPTFFEETSRIVRLVLLSLT